MALTLLTACSYPRLQYVTTAIDAVDAGEESLDYSNDALINDGASNSHPDPTGTFDRERDGTANGAPFSLPCPKGTVAVGIDGRNDVMTTAMFPTIVALALRCAALMTDGTLGPSMPLIAVGATSGGTAFSAECPKGSLVVGLFGHHGFILHGLGIECARLPEWLNSGTGKILSAEFGGSAGAPTAFDTACPKGLVVNLFTGKVDSKTLDVIQGHCVRVLP
ncbi:MAG: hypothetical protein NVS3B20_06430 [Polyangiales bacterium]